MNTKLPFEEAMEQQLSNLPAPHEDASWQKMKQLLDENKRRVAPPFYNISKYRMLLALMLLTLGLGFFVVSKKSGNEKEVLAENKKPNSGRAAEKKPKTLNPSLPNTATASVSVHRNDESAEFKPPISEPTKADDSAAEEERRNEATSTSAINNQSLNSGKSNIALKPSTKIFARKRHKNFLAKNYKVHRGRKAERLLIAGSMSSKIPENAGLKSNVQKADELEADAKISPVSSISTETKKLPTGATASQTDTLIQPKKDTAKQMLVNAKSKQVKSRSKHYFVTAGVGVQQVIPVGGQKTIAYGYNGKSAITDYIPSIGFTFERAGKWFVQGEFNYAAPQLVKYFAYRRLTNFDNTSRTLTTTTFNLKKTFYSEIPLSFNYYFKSNWSLGIGGMYSWLHGAIAEKEVSIKNVETQQQTVDTRIEPIKGFTDSFLYKSHTYLLLQAAYQLNRFSFGLRYTKDLQPYIRYTLPDGMIADKKNWSLEFIVRFRLWKAAMF